MLWGASIALQNSPAGNNQHDETIPDLQWPSLHTVSKRPLVTAKQLGMVAPPATSYDSYYNAGEENLEEIGALTSHSSRH